MLCRYIGVVEPDQFQVLADRLRVPPHTSTDRIYEREGNGLPECLHRLEERNLRIPADRVEVRPAAHPVGPGRRSEDQWGVDREPAERFATFLGGHLLKEVVEGAPGLVELARVAVGAEEGCFLRA